MRLLLDTHVLLWALAAPDRISRSVRQIITAPRNEVFASVVNLFEIAARGPAARRLSLDIDVTKVREGSIRAGYQILQVTAEHAIAIEGLALFHGDPFDRLLLAQALVEDMRLVTHDEVLASYDSRTILF